MPVRTIARSEGELLTAPPTATATDIAQIMDDHSVGSVILVENDHPVGIVTDRDLAMEIVKEGRDTTTPVSEFMSTDLVTADSKEGVMELCKRMQEHGIRRMPVVEGDGTLTGIVTLDDLVVLLEDELKNLSEVIRSESPPY